MRRCCILILVAASAAALFGQAATGTITGTVSDPGGAVVPNAPVEVRNADTGVVYSTATTNTGDYTVTQLPVGTYQVIVRAAGFKTYTHNNIQVQAAGGFAMTRRSKSAPPARASPSPRELRC